MLTVSEYATKHGITTQRVYQLIKQQRLKTKLDRGVQLILDVKFPKALKLGRPKYRSVK